jgi:hypothetical protein
MYKWDFSSLFDIFGVYYRPPFWVEFFKIALRRISPQAFEKWTK